MGEAMRLYHTSTADRADNIMINGFRDNATVNKRLFSGTTLYAPGVWFGNIPALDDELFDGIGLFDFDAEKQAFIGVDVRQPLRGIKSSAVNQTWPGTQYWGPASVWNKFPKVRLQLDDVLRLRLSARRDIIPKMKEWIAKSDPRQYHTEFHARVKRILSEADHDRVSA